MVQKFINSCVAALLVTLCVLVHTASSRVVHKRTFNSNFPIEIKDNAPAYPYPAVLGVWGFPPEGKVLNISVKIVGLTHPLPVDIGILLESPYKNFSVLTQAYGGGTPGVKDITMEFSDNGTTPIGRGLPYKDGGVYQPRDGDSYLKWAPPAPQKTFPEAIYLLEKRYAGYDPNGNWNLYVQDFHVDYAGIIKHGWELTFEFEYPESVDAESPADKTQPAGALPVDWVPDRR